MDVKTEAKLLKAFSKIFAEQPLDENRPPTTEEYPVMDPANVCMCVATSPEAKRVLSRFSNKNDEAIKVPPLDYDNAEGLAPISKYNTEYLKLIINCFSVVDESATLKLRRDYPLKVVGSEFYFVLAPRVEN